MIFPMIALCRGARFVILAALLLAGWHSARADVRSNPYLHIPERNVFALRPPPAPQPETNQAASTPPSKVILTGITSLFGPQVFLEITEQEPGKPPPTSPKRPILRAGDREGDIEVLSIDIERSIVRIRNRSVESELTFEVPKSGGGGGGAAAGGGNLAANPPPVVNPHGSPQGQPTIISSSEPRGGVTMLGGGGAFAGNSSGVTTFGGSTPMTSGTSGGISSFGGLPPTGGPGYSSAANPALAAAGGLPNIPSRTMRTPSTVPPAQQQIDPETQMILMEANRIKNEQINQAAAARGGGGKVMPPLPPTALSRQMDGYSGPPVPPIPTPR